MTKKTAGHQEASEMSLRNLHKVQEYSSKLLKMIRATDELPGWVEDKVSAMSDDVSEVYHYLEGENKVTAKVWVMKHLSKIAGELDERGEYKAAQAVDDTLTKIAQMDGDDDFDKLFDDPDMDFEEEDDYPDEFSPFGGESRYESGGVTGDVVPLGADLMQGQGDDLHSIMAAFIDGLADGMYDSLEDAMWEARNISNMYAELMEDEFPEPTGPRRELPGERDKGQVLEFKPRED